MSGATVAAAGAIYRRPVYLPPSFSAGGGVIDSPFITGSFTLSSNGSASGFPSLQPAEFTTWLISGAASSYEVLVNVTSGTMGSGTTGSWVSLSSNQTWTVTQNGPGTNQVIATVSIRQTTGSVVLVTGTLTLTAFVI